MLTTALKARGSGNRLLLTVRERKANKRSRNQVSSTVVKRVQRRKHYDILAREVARDIALVKKSERYTRAGGETAADFWQMTAVFAKDQRIFASARTSWLHVP